MILMLMTGLCVINAILDKCYCGCHSRFCEGCTACDCYFKLECEDMEKTNEFKNGVNLVIENILPIIHKAMNEKYGSHISIYSILLDIKSEIIKLQCVE